MTLRHWVVGLVACAASVFSQSAQAFNILGSGSYESMKSENSDDALTGFGLGLTAQADVFSAGIVSVIGGLGIRNSTVTFEQDVLGTKLETKMTNTWIGAEAGVDAALVPMLLNGQLVVGYDYGLSGTASIGDTNRDITKASRLALTPRVLLTVLPFIKVGAEYSMYMNGSMTVKGDTSDSETDFTGHRFGGIVGFSF